MERTPTARWRRLAAAILVAGGVLAAWFATSVVDDAKATASKAAASKESSVPPRATPRVREHQADAEAPSAAKVVEAPAAPQPDATDAEPRKHQLAISGVVRFRDGRPAAGMMVAAVPRNVPVAQTAESGDDGSFRIEGVQPGNCDLLVQPYPGKASVNARMTLVKNIVAGSVGVAIEVEPGMIISGRVLGPDGAPVAAGRASCDAVVENREETGAAVNGDRLDIGWSHGAEFRDGRFELTGLSVGTYAVSIRATGLTTQERHVEAGAQDVVFRLMRPATLKGHVLLPDHSPAKGTPVIIRDEVDDARRIVAIADTDADGRFVFGSVPAGVYGVSTVLLGVDQIFEGHVDGVRVAEGETVEGVEIQLKKTK